MAHKKYLEIGANVRPQAHLIWPNETVLTLDALESLKPDIVGDARDLPKAVKGAKFDGIFASHVLEHFPYWDTARVLKSWVDSLNDGGELHIVVPSLEWAAREILSDKPSPALHGHLYAGQTNEYDIHLTGFTMRHLRALFEHGGLNVMRARSGEYTIMVQGKEYKAEQHYVMGIVGAPPLRKE